LLCLSLSPPVFTLSIKRFPPVEQALLCFNASRFVSWWSTEHNAWLWSWSTRINASLRVNPMFVEHRGRGNLPPVRCCQVPTSNDSPTQRQESVINSSNLKATGIWFSQDRKEGLRLPRIGGRRACDYRLLFPERVLPSHSQYPHFLPLPDLSPAISDP